MPFVFAGCEKKGTQQETNTTQRRNTTEAQYTKQHSFTQVKKMVSEVFSITADSIKAETKLSNLGLKMQVDDIDYAELLMHIEAEFEIEISDDDAKKFTTIGEICDYIDKKASRF